jgi:LPS export ABC transporter permease LptF
MKLIDRYIARQLLANTFFAVAVFSLVLVIGNAFRRLLPLLVNRDVPAEYILSFIAYVLPYSLTFTIPWGLLTAVLMVFGRLSADNELTALRGNGVSIPRICAPLAVIAAATTALCLWLSLSVAPAARGKMSSVLFDLAMHNPMALFQSDQVIDQFPGRKIYVGRKEGNKLHNIIVFEIDGSALPMRVTSARTGSLETDLAHQRILLHLHEVRYQQRDERDPLNLRKVHDGINVQEGTLPISLSELYERNRRRGRSSQSIQELIEHLPTEDDARERSAYRTEISKRFSFPVSCLVFALIAVPLGVTTQRRETSAGFGIGLVVAFSYFVFVILADTLRENARVYPELLIWLPNVLFLAIGAVLFRRLARR